MPQTVEVREQIEQPLCGSTASATAENSPAAVPRERSRAERPKTGEESPAKRQKKEVADDIRGGTVSTVLKEEEHKTLLNLERTFPDWPSRRSIEPRVLVSRRKWAAIESEMRAIFPNLPVKKKTLQSICVHAGKQRELRELQRFKKACTDGAEDKSAVADLAHKVQFFKENAENYEKKLAEAEASIAGLQTALLQQSKKCDELQVDVRRGEAQVAHLNKQLLREVTWRKAQLQGPDEAGEEAVADATAA